MCSGGQCVSTCLSGETCCDGSCCNTEACERCDNGQCVFDCSLGGGACCDDGLFCNGVESCAAGSCQPGAEPCPGALCDEAADACVECFIDGDCTGACVACQGGVCAEGCDDGDPCTEDACVSGNCTHSVACDDSDLCTINDTCVAGACVGQPLPCDDGDPCTPDVCQDGVCVSLPPDCESSGDPCELTPFVNRYDNCDACSVTMNIPDTFCVNDDDDNGNGIPDYLDAGPVAGEDDLVPLDLTLSGCPPDLIHVLGGEGDITWHICEWRGHRQYRVYLGADKSDPVVHYVSHAPWPPPSRVWLEGLPSSEACLTRVVLWIGRTDPETGEMASECGYQGGETFVPPIDLDVDADHDTGITDQDEPIEEDLPGRYIGFNDDDDNANDEADWREDGPVAGEDELVVAVLNITAPDPIDVELRTVSGGSNIRLWSTPTKDEEIVLPALYNTANEAITLYVEGVNAGPAVLEAEVLGPPGCVDRIQLEVVTAELVGGGGVEVTEETWSPPEGRSGERTEDPPSLIKEGDVWLVVGEQITRRYYLAYGPLGPDHPERVIVLLAEEATGADLAGLGACTRMDGAFWQAEAQRWNTAWNALFGWIWPDPFTASVVQDVWTVAYGLDSGYLEAGRYWLTPGVTSTGPQLFTMQRGASDIQPLFFTVLQPGKVPLGGERSVPGGDQWLKAYVPTRWGGRLTVTTTAGTITNFTYPDGAPYVNGTEVGQDRHGWYRFQVTGAPGGYTVSATFLQEGESEVRPWNFYWWSDKADYIREPETGGNGTADSTVAAGTDDVQVVEPGGSVTGGANIVRSGDNGTLESTESGDDERRERVNLFDNAGPYQPLLKYDSRHGTIARVLEAGGAALRAEDGEPTPEWWGHCLGAAIASIALNQPVPVAGSNYNRDELEGLWAELGEHTNHQLNPAVGPIPAGPPELGTDDTDSWAPQYHALLEEYLKTQGTPLYSQMRAHGGPANEVWNHAVYKFSATFEETAAENETVVNISNTVWANKIHEPPTDSTSYRLVFYEYTMRYKPDGRPDLDYSGSDWIVVTGEADYAPQYLSRLVTPSWVGNNPDVIEANVRADDAAN